MQLAETRKKFEDMRTVGFDCQQQIQTKWHFNHCVSPGLRVFVNLVASGDDISSAFFLWSWQQIVTLQRQSFHNCNRELHLIQVRFLVWVPLGRTFSVCLQAKYYSMWLHNVTKIHVYSGNWTPKVLPGLFDLQLRRYRRHSENLIVILPLVLPQSKFCNFFEHHRLFAIGYRDL